MSDNSIPFQFSKKAKALITFILLIIIASVGFYIAPKFINTEKYKQYFIDEVNQLTGKKTAINGNVDVSINPLMNRVKITLRNLVVSSSEDDKNIDLINAGKFIVNINLSDFFFGRMNLYSLELESANINLTDQENRSESLNSIQKIYSQDSKLAKLSSIEIRNSILSHKNFFSISTYNDLNMLIKFKGSGVIDVKGNALNNDNETINIAAKFGSYNEQHSQEFKMNLGHNSNIINFQGNILRGNEGDGFVGAMRTHLVNPSIVIKDTAIALPFLQPMLRDKFNDQMDVTADVIVSSNRFDIKNIKLTSVHTEGVGSVGFSLNSEPNLYVNFNFEKLDLNNFLNFDDNAASISDSAILEEDEIIGAMQGDNSEKFIELTFIDKEKLSINFVAKSVTVRNLALQNVQIELEAQDGVFNKGEASLQLNNQQYNTSVKLTNLAMDKVNDSRFILGDFVHEGNNINETLKIFNLQDYLSIKEDNLSYKINSKIIFASKEISIFDINGEIGENGTFTGSIATKKDNLTDYNFDLKFNNLKLNNFEMPLFKERISILLNKSNDDDYLSYFRWFRTLSSTYSLRFEFADTEFKNEKIVNLINECRLEPGSMSLKGQVKSDFANGNYDLNLIAQEIKPRVTVNITGDNLDYTRLSNLMFGFMLEDNGIPLNEKQTDNAIWSDKKFNWFKIQKYVAQFDVALKKLQVNQEEMDNFKFIGHTSGDIFYLDNLYLGVYGGELQTRGNISFFEPILYQFSFTASGLESKDLLASIIPEFNAITGPTVATGSVISQGNSLKDFIGNLGASINFASPKLNIKGVDADVVVNIALKRQLVEQNKVLDQLDLALNAGDTDITDVNGSLKIAAGVLKTQDTSFKTRFSNAAFVMSLDLNALTMSSDVRFSFMPYSTNTPVSYSISQSGELSKNLNRQIDESDLLNFVKQKYNLFTPIKKPAIVQKPSVEGDADSKNYIYHQLEESNGQ